MLDIALDALACYRIVRFVVDDTLIDDQRDRARTWLIGHGHDKIVEGLGCYWCAGIWAAAAVVVARRTMPVTWPLAARALALSASVGIADLAVHRLMVRRGAAA